MRSLVPRLKRLERIERRAARPHLFLHHGYWKTLPLDDVGLRHQVTIRRIPPEELPPSSRAGPWFEWEERRGPGPGPEPTCEPIGREDEIVVKVQMVLCANRPMPPMVQAR